jgi:hypothetical protein
MGITIDTICEAGKDTDYKLIDDEHDERQFQLLVPLVDGDPIEQAPEFLPMLDLVPLPAHELDALVPLAGSDASLDSPQSRSRNFMSEAEKLYLEAQSPTTSVGLVCPDKHTIMSMITTGQASGSLSAGVTYEGVRSHLRKTEKYFQMLAEAGKKDEKKDKKVKKKDKKATEKDKKADTKKDKKAMNKDKATIDLD